MADALETSDKLFQYFACRSASFPTASEWPLGDARQVFYLPSLLRLPNPLSFLFLVISAFELINGWPVIRVDVLRELVSRASWHNRIHGVVTEVYVGKSWKGYLQD
jgi:hypothetical protein